MTGAAHIARPTEEAGTGRNLSAVHKAFAVLEEVSMRGPGMSAREVSAALGLPRATTYRLIALLIDDGYLEPLGHPGGLRLGPKTASFVDRVELARPTRAVLAELERLRATIRGGVHLVSYRGRRVHFVDVDPEYPVSDARLVARDPRRSAVGRLLLADLGGETGEELRAALALSPEDAATLRERIAQTGYAEQRERLVAGFGCLAFPIRGAEGGLIAALAYSAPTARIEEPGEIVAQLRRGASALEPLLG